MLLFFVCAGVCVRLAGVISGVVLACSVLLCYCCHLLPHPLTGLALRLLRMIFFLFILVVFCVTRLHLVPGLIGKCCYVFVGGGAIPFHYLVIVSYSSPRLSCDSSSVRGEVNSRHQTGFSCRMVRMTLQPRRQQPSEDHCYLACRENVDAETVSNRATPSNVFYAALLSVFQSLLTRALLRVR